MSTTLAIIETLADDRRRTSSSGVIDWTANGFRAINGALQIWNQQHDWPWQLETVNFNYNEGITYYPLSSSLNFKAIADLRPFRAAEREREFYYVMNSSFDSDLLQPWRIAVSPMTQGQMLRVKYTGNSMTINPATSLSDNGTWVGATAISNVATDTYEYWDLNASVKFDYSGTSGTLTNSTFNAVDLSLYSKRSTIYFNVYFQNVDQLSTLTIKVGTDASNYITGSISTDYLGNTFVTGWNKCKLIWDGGTTTVGTVTPSSIGYIQVTITYIFSPATKSNRVENFFVSENVPLVLEYYSHNMARSSLSQSKVEVFSDASVTTDTTLWSGTWDYVNEAFINSVMEIIEWMNGAVDDRAIAVQRIQAFVEPLKSKLPSKRRHAEVHMTADLNGPDSRRGNPLRYNRRWY